MTDDLGRPLITDEQRERIRQAFSAVPQGKHGAMLVIADETSVRAQLAVKFGDHWSVAAGAGLLLAEKRPAGWCAVEVTW